MSAAFEILGHEETPMGVISLRRRHDPVVDVDLYEVKLGDEYLMSSLFTVAEEELAHLALAVAPDGPLDVLVGGLGLGYTALAAMADPRVRAVAVVEALGPVIGWHRDRLLPATTDLLADGRCRLVQGDFFALARADRFVPDGPGRFHAILLDIDHAPDRVLHPSHADFYTPAGLQALATHLHPGGVFALWSDDPPDPAVIDLLADAVGPCEGHLVAFDNPLTGGRSTNAVYVARQPEGSDGAG